MRRETVSRQPGNCLAVNENERICPLRRENTYFGCLPHRRREGALFSFQGRKTCKTELVPPQNEKGLERRPIHLNRNSSSSSAFCRGAGLRRGSPAGSDSTPRGGNRGSACVSHRRSGIFGGARSPRSGQKGSGPFPVRFLSAFPPFPPLLGDSSPPPPHTSPRGSSRPFPHCIGFPVKGKPGNSPGNRETHRETRGKMDSKVLLVNVHEAT
jgi:hypothetical protein